MNSFSEFIAIKDHLTSTLAKIIERELNQMGENVKGLSWFSSVAQDYVQSGSK